MSPEDMMIVGAWEYDQKLASTMRLARLLAVARIEISEEWHREPTPAELARASEIWVTACLGIASAAGMMIGWWL